MTDLTTFGALARETMADLITTRPNTNPTACSGCGATGEPLGGTDKCADCVSVDVHNYRALHDGRMKIRQYRKV